MLFNQEIPQTAIRGTPGEGSNQELTGKKLGQNILKENGPIASQKVISFPNSQR